MNENMADNRRNRDTDIDGNEYNPSAGSTAYDAEGLTEQSTGYPASDSEKRKLQKEDESSGSGSETVAKKKKTSLFGFSQTFSASKLPESKRPAPAPISIKLGAQKAKQSQPSLKKTSVADVFNQSSDEEEEMPPEAKMRMRNIGRDTPTSAGPNSFGKTRQGFCDMKKVFERQLLKQMEELSD